MNEPFTVKSPAILILAFVVTVPVTKKLFSFKPFPATVFDTPDIVKTPPLL